MTRETELPPLRPDTRSGDFDAFFLAGYDGLVRALGAAYGDREQAADAVQEAYLRAFTRWWRVRRLDNPTAWVRRVAVNLLNDQHRRHGRRERVLDRLRAITPTEQAPPEPPHSPLVAAMRELPQQQRTAAALFYLEDASVAEVAQAMGLSQGAVKYHLNQARESLRQLLPAEQLLMNDDDRLRDALRGSFPHANDAPRALSARRPAMARARARRRRNAAAASAFALVAVVGAASALSGGERKTALETANSPQSTTVSATSSTNNSSTTGAVNSASVSTSAAASASSVSTANIVGDFEHRVLLVHHDHRFVGKFVERSHLDGRHLNENRFVNDKCVELHVELVDHPSSSAHPVGHDRGGQRHGVTGRRGNSTNQRH